METDPEFRITKYFKVTIVTIDVNENKITKSKEIANLKRNYKKNQMEIQ